MSTILEERQRQLVSEFQKLTNWEARYKRIIEMGKALPEFSDAWRTEDLKVRGCQSQVWLKASLNDQGQMIIAADSDALIVKGLIALLVQIYSGASPQEILTTEPSFVHQLGLSEHLSPSRANGFMSMLKQIKYYAAAFSVLQSQKGS